MRSSPEHYPLQLFNYYDGLTMEVFIEARALLREYSEAPNTFDVYDQEDARGFSTETRYDRAGSLGAALITAAFVRSETWARRSLTLSGLLLCISVFCAMQGNLYAAVPLLLSGVSAQPLLYRFFGYAASQRALFEAVVRFLRSRGVTCGELP